MPETQLDVPVVTVDGRRLTPELHRSLLQFRVEESIMMPDRFSLHFDDPHFELFDQATFGVGARIELGMEVSGEPVIMTVGEVVALSVELGRTGRHELVISGYDLSHRLTRRTRRRTFQAMTDADIAAQIAREHSLRTRIALPGGGVQNDYVLQANETDLVFLQRLALRNGADVWVHEDTLHLAQRTGPAGNRTIPLTWGRNLTRFSVRFSAAPMVDEVIVRAWDAQRAEAIVAQSGDLRPASKTAQEFADQAAATFGATSRTATWWEVPDNGAAAHLAESLHARALSEAVVVRGEAIGDPWLGAGSMISLEGVGDRLSDEYKVTNVTHQFGLGGPYRTRFVCGGLEPHDLADLVSGGTPGAAARPGTLPTLVVGVVTDTADSLTSGRVRVSLPSLDDQAESTWARVALPGAGNRTGLVWIPEIGDEVLVGFELGDTSRPIVLGGLWSQANPAPDVVESGAETKNRALVTAGEHRIVLDDADAQIRLEVGGCAARLTLAARGSTLDGDSDLTISAGTITIEADQALKLSGTRVQIEASADVTVSGNPIKLN